MSTSAFDPARAYALHPDVALRPERFGALAYHYGNRRLTFLKTPELAAVVGSLEEHASADAALAAHGVAGGARAAYVEALAGLEASEVIGAR